MRCKLDVAELRLRLREGRRASRLFTVLEEGVIEVQSRIARHVGSC